MIVIENIDLLISNEVILSGSFTGRTVDRKELLGRNIYLSALCRQGSLANPAGARSNFKRDKVEVVGARGELVC